MFNFFDIILKAAILAKKSRKAIRSKKALKRLMPTLNVNQYTREVLTDPRRITKKLTQMSRAERKEWALELNETIVEQGEKADFAFLKSTWIVSGVFEKAGVGAAGSLTLTLKSGRSYTWYSVPEHVWLLMKDTTNAGTIFWALYLRGAKQTVAHQKVALAFKLAGIKPIK